MRRPQLDWLRLPLLVLGLALFVPLPACGGGGASGEDGDDDDDDDDDDDGGGGGIPPTASAARGALLYDQWWSVTGASAPTGLHPAYPVPPGIQTGSTNWRCAECHGSDYEGASGAYATGAHQTGVIGVLAGAGATPQSIFDAIQGLGTTHDFATELGTADTWDLVAFVKTGASDMSPWITSAGVAQGNVSAGGSRYATNCASCHGADGKSIDLGAGKGVGDLATNDPWLVLHQIRWGVAGTNMPSMVAAGLTASAQADLLAYCQSLSGTAPPPPPPPPPATLSYAADIQPIWAARNCTGCHGSSGGLTLTGSANASYTELAAGRLDLATPTNSLILKKPATIGVSHGGGKFFATTSDADYQKILKWIQEGGANN